METALNHKANGDAAFTLPLRRPDLVIRPVGSDGPTS